MNQASENSPLATRSNARGEQQHFLSLIFGTGFRPFFLAAAGYAVLNSLLWPLVDHDYVYPLGNRSLLGPVELLRLHEAVFGVLMAAVAGFALTATRFWTAQPTAHGGWLAGLFGTWVAGRAMVLSLALVPDSAVPPTAVLVGIQLSFPLLLVLGLARPMWVARYTRGLPLLAVIAGLAASSVAFWLDIAGFEERFRLWPMDHLLMAEHLLVLLSVVVGGQMIPLVSRERLGDPGIQPAREEDHLALMLAAAAVSLVAASVYLPLPSETGKVAGFTLIASGFAQLYRMRTWGTLSALRVPMLAVLHVGYAWVGVGQLLVGLGWLGLDPWYIFHRAYALPLGTLTLGMVACFTASQTGRELVATRAVAAAFVLVQLAALALLLPVDVVLAWPKLGYTASSLLFGAAWLLWLLHGAGPLTSPRPDGRPG